MRKILVLGGYGVFGRRICERLARFDDIELIIAGRSRKKALELIETLSDPLCSVRSLEIDIHTAHISELENLEIFAVINACGPYHDQDYSIAEMCIDIGAHYIDLSDNRDFVANIEVLNGRAKRADVFVTSGASTVPALSSAVLDHYIPAFSQLTSVDYGVTPGNKTDRGVGTIAAILKYVGRPFKTLIKGEERVVHGWQNLHRTHYPVIGKRWMSNCDIPDLDLFQSRYKDLETIRFYAGLELSILHVGLWILSWPCRWGWIKDFDRYASLMRRVSLWFYPLGSDRGGMHVFMRGLDEDGARMQKDWCVIACDGVGPYIPATPSVILVRKLLDGTLDRRGALPCLGLFSLNDFMEEISDLSIKDGLG